MIALLLVQNANLTNRLLHRDVRATFVYIPLVESDLLSRFLHARPLIPTKKSFSWFRSRSEGTVLKSLFAHQAGASKIYGCDYSQTMITIALQVLHKHGLVSRIKLVNELSNNLKIPKDLPGRISMVVTETLDSCMLGEHILHTLNHAWKYLLKPPRTSDPNESTAEANSNGTVIPQGGSLWLRLIQSPSLARNYMFPLNDTNADDCAATLANISLKGSGETVDFHDLQISRIYLRTSSNEPYDTERLQDLPDCYLHAIGAWFNIQLDESISISSAPDSLNSINCCWTKQFFLITHPNGDTITMDNSALPAHQQKSLKIMDLYPIPIFGLTVLRNLPCIGLAYSDALVVCVVKSPAEEELIKSIAKSNAIPLGCLSFVNVEDFDAAMSGTWQQYFDTILVNFLESDGVINEEAVCRISSLKLLLKPGGVLLPKKILINGHLINSDFIERSMRVIDDDIHKSHKLLDVNVATLKYEKYSNTCLFYAFSPENMDSEFHENHAVLAIQNGTVNSILCWFEFSILDDHSFYSSLHNFSYIHQTAFLPKSPIMLR
ncbi:hypothetical protein ACFE04_011159 [Oxalis oulophora]